MKSKSLLKTLFKLYFFLISININSQIKVNTNYSLNGLLFLKDSSILTYKIEFKTNNEFKFQGTSLTDYYGPNKTKSIIFGEWDDENKTISFYETLNTFTKSNSKPNEFCFIKVNNAKFKEKRNKLFIDGFFEAYYNNDQICTTGKMALISNLNLNLNNIKINSVDSSILDLTVNNSQKSNLSSEDKFIINTISDSVNVEIWDGQEMDNDKITIQFNTKFLLKNFQISKVRHKINLALHNGINDLIIFAENEGLNPPNTVNLNISGNDFNIPLITKLKLGQKAKIQIINKLK